MAQSVDELATQQLRRAQEREAQQRERLEPRPDVRLPAPEQAPARILPPQEAPCFPIHRLELEADASERFGWLKDEADGHAQLEAPDPALGRCLGAQGIQVVIQRLQHALIARGFVTTRVLAGAQNLQSGTLVLTVLPGRIGDIRWADQTGERGSRWNTVPAQAGELLDVRDLEQALENYQRPPTAEADIQIAPGRESGTSDLVIAHRQAWPFRVSATLEDSGSRTTGKRQASLTLSYDNALNLSDLFYISLLRDLGGSEPGERGTRGHVAHYSVPWGYWLLAITNSANRFQGGSSRAVLHAIAGGLTGGAAGAAGAAAASAAAPQIGQLQDQLAQGLRDAGLPASAAQGIAGLASGTAAAAIGGAVGGVAGTAAAFNTDMNNRQLHPAEIQRIRQIANGDAEREARLTAAACALVRCHAEYPEGSASYEQMRQLAAVGASDALAGERQLLQQQGGLFAYSTQGIRSDVNSDSLRRINNTYQITERATGAAQLGLGIAGFA